MLNKTVTGLKNKSEAVKEERRLNALTLAVQLFSSGIIEATTKDLFDTTEAFYMYLENGYIEDEEIEECEECAEPEEVVEWPDDCLT